MNINPINTTVQPNFKGMVITQGKWVNGYSTVFADNKNIIKAAKNHTIYGEMKEVTASGQDNIHYPGETLYRISIIAKKDNPTLLEKFKYFLGFAPKTHLTLNFHSLRGTGELLKNEGLIAEALRSLSIK